MEEALPRALSISGLVPQDQGKSSPEDPPENSVLANRKMEA